MRDSRNSQNPGQSQGGQSGNSSGGDGNRSRRRRRGGRSGGQGGQPRQGAGPRPASAENRNRDQQNSSRASGRSRRGGRPLTTNQVLVKYDNLLEQHLITRRKYFEYFNRVDDRQLKRLEKNFFTSIEHLRRFEANLEPWQREALEKRKTERYRLDLTYSGNRDIPAEEALTPKVEVAPEEIEDPHFKDTQKEAFEEYKDDTEESVGTFEDYLKLKGLE